MHKVVVMFIGLSIKSFKILLDAGSYGQPTCRLGYRRRHWKLVATKFRTAPGIKSSIIISHDVDCGNSGKCVFQYPFIPAHITKPKEHKRLFLVQLPEKGNCRFLPQKTRDRRLKCLILFSKSV